MAEKSFTWQDSTVTVREQIGWDALDAQLVINRLASKVDLLDPLVNNRVVVFVAAVTQTVKVEHLPFAWVTAKSSADELFAAYNEWGKPGRALLVMLWRNTMHEADNETPGDPDTRPDVDSQKKQPPPPNASVSETESMKPSRAKTTKVNLPA